MLIVRQKDNFVTSMIITKRQFNCFYFTSKTFWQEISTTFFTTSFTLDKEGLV